jgi:hypothetical protein
MQHAGHWERRDSDDGWLCLVDSVNYVGADHRGCVILSGSHGGSYSSSKGLSIGPRAMIFNDAGVGFQNAGIACLALGEQHGVAAATVSYLSARIGDAGDMRRRGVISHVNAPARAAGVSPGMSCADALSFLASCEPSQPIASSMTENRHEIAVAGGLRPAICIDSASLILPQDEGAVVVTGSHGGLIGGNAGKAINVPCAFAAFNDAGVGCDSAGLGRLVPLDARAIAAVTVDHRTASIGDAVSTLEQGVISHANARARQLGVRPGDALREAIASLLA